MTYYYEPYSQTFHNNVVDARTKVITRFTAERLLTMIGCEVWQKVTTQDWCEEHPEELCEFLGIYRMRTRTRLEVRLRFWLYRLVAKIYGFQWTDVTKRS